MPQIRGTAQLCPLAHMASHATCLPVSSGKTNSQTAHGRKLRDQLERLILHPLAGVPGCLSRVRILLRG